MTFIISAVVMTSSVVSLGSCTPRVKPTSCSMLLDSLTNVISTPRTK